MIVRVVTQGVSAECNSLAVTETGIYQRIPNYGDCFALHYSHDAKWREMVRYFRLERSGPVKEGVVAQSPTGDSCQVILKHLNYSPEPVTEIRSGK